MAEAEAAPAEEVVEGEPKKKKPILLILVIVLSVIILIMSVMFGTLYFSGFYEKKAELAAMDKLEELEAAATKAMAERDALKSQVKELSVGDTTSVIRKLQVEVKNAESARWREGEKTKDALKQVYALKKELKRLGAVEIPL